MEFPGHSLQIHHRRQEKNDPFPAPEVFTLTGIQGSRDGWMDGTGRFYPSAAAAERLNADFPLSYSGHFSPQSVSDGRRDSCPLTEFGMKS